MVLSALVWVIVVGLGLVVVILVQYVQYEFLEKRYYEVQDGYLNLVIGKKLIEPANFLRQDEKEFFSVLKQIYGEGYNIVPQVHLSNIAEVISGYRDHDNLYFELKRIIFDYVVFDKGFNPVVAIELNGKSHFAKNRISRDSRAKNFAENLKIPFVAILTEDRFNKVKIGKELAGVTSERSK
jgi:hypothetical protein